MNYMPMRELYVYGIIDKGTGGIGNRNNCTFSVFRFTVLPVMLGKSSDCA